MNNTDFTKGSILRTLIAFMIPLIIGNVFQQAYSLVDAIIVGQTLGNTAFTGVGCTSSASFLVIGFANGLTAGLTIPTSQFFGAQHYDQMRRSIATSFTLSAVLSVLLTVGALVTAKPLLVLLNTSETLMPYAYDYLFTIFAGIAATIFYNLVCFMLRSIGDSKAPLIALIIASGLNIGFDFLFILVFKMGTAGAGWATLLSQFLSGVMCLIYMFRRYPFLRLKKADWQFSYPFAKKHLRIAIPMAFQFSIIAIGLMVQQSTVNGLDVAGSDLYATSYSAASKIDNFGLSVLSALGTAMATFCGQNFGANDFPRIKRGFRIAVIIGISMSVILSCIIIPFGSSFLHIFLNEVGDEIRINAQRFMTFQCVFYPLAAFIYIFRSGLQGLGESQITVLAGILELIMRILACVVLASLFAWTGLCLSNPCAWLGSDLVLLPATYIYLKKHAHSEKIES